MTDLLSYLVSLFGYDQSHPLLFTQIHFWVFFLFVYIFFSFFTTNKPLTHHRRICRNAYLFIVSLFFYYKTSGLFVLLLLFSTLLGYTLGLVMDNSTKQHRRKVAMITGGVVNLIVLFYFKYASFFTDIYNTTFHTTIQVIDWLAQWSNHAFHTTRFSVDVIILPVGISFFTFQNISYIVDVYRRKIPHVGNILDFGFYTSFFPQLVAGPILRAEQFVPQLYRPFFLSRRQFGIAVFWILNGLIKKLILSDYLAINFVDRVFDNPSLYTPFENFSALLVYSLQVYADFSGYTDIATGVAILMGFYLPINFRSPYKATNPSDFWRRWHVSLGRWLRDYLYIPLGGNRTAGFVSFFILFFMLTIASFMLQNWVFSAISIIFGVTDLALWLFLPSKRKIIGTDINNMDTMLLGGLWHGASFNFITWGGLNGLGILVFKWWNRHSWKANALTLCVIMVVLQICRAIWPLPLLNILAYVGTVFLIGYVVIHILPQERRGVKKASVAWSILLTFVFISFTRLFFRSGSNLNPAEANEVAWRTASMMVGQIGGKWNLALVPPVVSHYANVFLLFVFGMIVHWLPERFKRRYRIWFASMPLWLMATVMVVAAVVLYQFVSSDLQPFIYFQF